VPAPNSGFTTVAAGWRHSLGLKADGSVVAWGRNDHLQCLVPDPNSGFIAIAGGSSHSLGLKGDGSVVPWGGNDYGQRNSPEPNHIYIGVSAGGGYDSYALTRPLSVACCRIDGTCTLTTPEECDAIGGTPAGDGVSCDPNPCGIASADGSAPAGTLRISSAPNPSGGATLMLYEVPRATHVALEVYDAAGRAVRRFPIGMTQAGTHSLQWDGRDRDGRVLPAGIYLTRITTDAGVKTGRLVIIGR
jgi:hypothetical protein